MIGKNQQSTNITARKPLSNVQIQEKDNCYSHRQKSSGQMPPNTIRNNATTAGTFYVTEFNLPYQSCMSHFDLL